MRKNGLRKKWLYGKKAVLLIVLSFVVVNFQLQAQNSGKVDELFKAAQTSYSKANYSKTIDLCNQILAENPDLVGVEMLLANVYSKQKNSDLELKHLYKAMKLNSHPYIKWRIGEVYLSRGNYSEALNYYNIYSNYKNISEKRRMELACKRASCIFNIQQVKNVANNSNLPAETYWPVPAAGGKKLLFEKGNTIANPKQADRFISEFDTLTGGVFEPVNDSLFLSADEAEIPEHQKIIFFTGSNRLDGFGDADIYFSRFSDGKWSNPVNAGNTINTKYYESQPFFTADNKYLYFVSNRPGSAGGKDIWRAELLQMPETGAPVWKTPENLSEINSSGNDISPFYYAKKQQLYFASNSQLGLGGYDVFMTAVDDAGVLSTPENVGAPVNTDADEIGVVISPISDTAFFSLARDKGEGGLEIFSYNYVRGLHTQPPFYIYFELFDSKTNLPVISGIEVADQSYNPAKVKYYAVGADGKLMLNLKANHTYTFTVSEKGYMVYTRNMTLGKSNSVSDHFEMKIGLTPIEVGSLVNLYNIYFETNSYALLPNSESELNRVVGFLNSNKSLKVEIQGHTDSSGNPEANLKLSRERAKSVVDFLVKKGIASNRLKYSGYGDTKPIANNDTEEGRKQNRRTTIKIVEK